MNDVGHESLETRVLLLAPTVTDGELTHAILTRADVACVTCPDQAQVCEQLTVGAGAVLIAEEAVHGGDGGLAEWLGRQPPWSDLPVLILARAGASSAAVAWAMEKFGNVTVLERPARVAALVSAVRSALRARQRQYQLRDQLFQRERFADPLNIAMAAHPGSWQVNLTTGEFSASDRAIELHGLPPGTHLNHERALACVHPDDRASIEAALRQTLESGKPFRHEYRMPQPDGSVRWVSSHAERRGEGNQTCVVGHVQDITDRKQAEEALRASEERFRLAADAVNGIIYEWDILTGHIERQRGLYQVLGYHAAEVPPTATWWREQIHPDDLEVIEQQFKELVGNSVVGEYRVRHRDGRWLHVEDRAMLQRGDDGRVARMIGCTMDVTERKRAEQTLTERTELLNGVLEGTTDVIFAKDLDGRVMLANAACAAVLGATPEQLVGKTGEELHPPDLAAAIRQHDEGVIAGGLPIQLEETIPVAGEPRVFLTLKAPLRDSSGRIVGVLGISRDVTERKGAAEERRLLASIVENSRDFIGISDTHGNPVYGNRAAMELVGVQDLEQVRRSKIIDYFIPEQRGFVAEVVLPAVINDGRWVGELTFQHFVTGATIPVLYDLFRVDDSVTGRPINFATITRDLTESKRAEETMRASTERLTMAKNAAALGIHAYEVKTGRIEWDERVRALWGVSPDMPINYDTFLSGVHPEDKASIQAAVDKALDPTGDGQYAAEYRVENRTDGVVRWVAATGIVFFEGNEAVRLIGTVQDITDRKRAETALQVSEIRYRRLFESAKDGILILDAHAATITDANPFMAEMLGFSQDEFVGKELWQIGLFKDVEASKAAMRELQEKGYIRYEDLPLETKAGRRINVEFVSNVYGENGETVIQCNIRDITNRRETERALAKALIYTDDIIATLREPFVVLDGSLRVKTANRSFYDSFNVSKGETENHFVYDLGNGQWDIPALRTLLDRVLSRNESVHDFEVEHTFPALGRKTMLLNARPFLPDSKHPELILLAVEDVSAVRERADELAAANRRKDEFLATLSHELRNPLAPLRNGLQVMKLSRNNGEVVEQARAMMDRQLSQLVRLVDDLLDVSRITQGKVALRKERLDLKAVINAAMETSRPAIEQAGHELAVVVPNEPIFVDGDAVRLGQVVSNLLINSVKYTHRAGHIRLTVGREDGMAVVSVKDDGIGIPPAMLGRVFEMFTQVDRTLETTTGGLGIGLSLVKGLLDMHGGTIEARSDGEGMGSEFVVRLPVVMSDLAEPDRPNGQTSEIVPSARRRILVVDDSVDATDSLRLLLEMSGHEVRTANDGEAGIAVAAQFRPDVVLMDIGMPKLNGHEAARRIRQQPWGRGMVLVALTGWGREDDRKKSADAGFDHHLVKPVEIDALMKLMRT